MTNTAKSFSDKWSRNPSAFLAETLREGSDTFNWIVSRNGLDGADGLRRLLADRRRVLDAGCGNGRVCALLRRYSDADTTEIVGIDLVSSEIAHENLAAERNVRFEARDLLGDLTDLGTFDFIYCQEVLHHTADPRRAFLNLCTRLEPDGVIAIYVYGLKAPVREFVDDFIRERIAGLEYERALEVCEQITAFGKALAESGARVQVPAVPVLGIEPGEYDVQRLLYHFFMKCYWNPDLPFAENAVVNYDWYHPQDASRHTVEEVRGWFDEAGLAIEHTHVDHYGITMRARAPVSAMTQKR